MPFCPVCKYEYIEGIKKCPDCDVALVAQLPVEKSATDMDQELVTVARIRLETAGIECAVVNNLMIYASVITTVVARQALGQVGRRRECSRSSTESPRLNWVNFTYHGQFAY